MVVPSLVQLSPCFIAGFAACVIEGVELSIRTTAASQVMRRFIERVQPTFSTKTVSKLPEAL